MFSTHKDGTTDKDALWRYRKEKALGYINTNGIEISGVHAIGYASFYGRECINHRPRLSSGCQWLRGVKMDEQTAAAEHDAEQYWQSAWLTDN